MAVRSGDQRTLSVLVTAPVLPRLFWPRALVCVLAMPADTCQKLVIWPTAASSMPCTRVLPYWV